MHECDYCDAEFDGEDAYLDHLADEHEGELGRIDRRRVEDHTGEGGGIVSAPVVAALVLGLAVVGALGAAVYFSAGNGTNDPSFPDSVEQPTNVGGPHYHGTITVTIDGEQLDFSRSRYQVQDNAFHFENRDGQRWHGHANGITLEYALETLGIGVTDRTLQFDGTVYNRSQGDTVVYQVNGEQVNPETYELRDGDVVTVVAEKS